MAPRTSAGEFEIRCQKIAGLIANGASRAHCLRYAAEQWGAKPRTVDGYMKRAKEMIRENWSSVTREEMLAQVLSQYASLQVQARQCGQLHVALGAIHGAARVAQLIS